MKRRFPGCLFLFLGSIFPILGITMAEEQRRRFDRWMEVPAEITGHEIAIGSDSDGRETCTPSLKLRYLADGLPPEGKGLLAFEVSSSHQWAEEQLAPWPVGKRVTAWVDPQNLGRAFVVREVSPLPYLVILAPMIFVSIGAVFLLFPPGEGKVYEPGTPWAGRTFVIVWNAVGIASAAHYFVQPGAWNAGGIALFGVYLGIGAVPVVAMVRRALKSRG